MSLTQLLFVQSEFSSQVFPSASFAVQLVPSQVFPDVQSESLEHVVLHAVVEDLWYGAQSVHATPSPQMSLAPRVQEVPLVAVPLEHAMFPW